MAMVVRINNTSPLSQRRRRIQSVARSKVWDKSEPRRSGPECDTARDRCHATAVNGRFCLALSVSPSSSISQLIAVDDAVSIGIHGPQTKLFHGPRHLIATDQSILVRVEAIQERLDEGLNSFIQFFLFRFPLSKLQRRRGFLISRPWGSLAGSCHGGEGDGHFFPCLVASANLLFRVRIEWIVRRVVERGHELHRRDIVQRYRITQ